MRSTCPPASHPFAHRCFPRQPCSPRSSASAMRAHAAAGYASSSRTDTLRRLLQQPTILKGPCCHDALSARLIERAGFSYAFMSGFCTSGARLGAPDTGLISYAEMVDQGRYIIEATKSIPVIGDGDNGYGNAMNVKRTVKGYARAGFAGILIEDQMSPKSCGHVRGKRIVGREEAVSRIRAAADARDEGADILIVARTDARQAASLEEAMWRVAAFADAGADILFIDALESQEEMKKFCRGAGGRAAGLPKMANMLEGGGKTPVLSPEELQEMGYKLVAYPLSLLGVSIRAMETALEGLKQGRVPSEQQIGTFADIQAAVGFPEYYEEEARYALSSPFHGASLPTDPGGMPEVLRSTPPPSPSPSTGSSAAAGGPEVQCPTPPPSPSPASSSGGSSGAVGAAMDLIAAEKAAAAAAAKRDGGEGAAGAGSASGAGAGAAGKAAVDADAVIEDSGTSVVVLPRPGEKEGGGEDKGQGTRRSQFFRVRISDVATDLVKLETRIPAGFVSGLTALLPAVSGFNLELLVERAMNLESRNPANPLFSTVQGGDKIQIFLE